MSAADEKAVLVQRLASAIRGYRRRRLNAKPTPSQTNWWKVFAFVVTGIVVLFIIAGILGEPAGSPSDGNRNRVAIAEPTSAATVQPSPPRPARRTPNTSQSLLALGPHLDYLSETAAVKGARAADMFAFDGHFCPYVQVATALGSPSYFFDDLTNSDTLIIFDEPGCMNRIDYGGNVDRTALHDASMVHAQNEINRAVASWHGREDAAFLTDLQDLQLNRDMQQRGWCIQSSKYPTVSIAVDYFIDEDGGLTAAIHSGSIGSCSSDK